AVGRDPRVRGVEREAARRGPHAAERCAAARSVGRAVRGASGTGEMTSSQVEMKNLEERLRQVEARLEIIELEGTYARSFDDRDGDTWSSLFTPDGIYQARVIDGEQQGSFVQGTEALRDFCTNARFTGIHFLHLPQVQID